LEIMREVSLQSDPQRMITLFRRHTATLFGGEGSISLSRRGLEYPKFRITRSTRWPADIDPWKEPERLPVLSGGMLAEFIHHDTAQILEDMEIPADDPVFPHLSGARSLMVLPLFDSGTALNMVVRYSREPFGFRQERLADAILVANLFGKATNHLLTARRLEKAYAELDHEMKRVAALQRSLLPARVPPIPGVDVAVSYKTAARAGGDYYDFFDLSDGRWGVLIADVSGHGTPAAVIMAILRTMLRNQCLRHGSPAELLAAANRQLVEQARRYDGMFVTAFYGIYDSKDRSLCYSCAGHHPPLLVGPGRNVRELDEVQSLPLAVEDGCEFPQARAVLGGGDTLLLYTDGITDAINGSGESYGRDRLLACVREDVPFAQHIVDCVTHRLIGFTAGRPQADDQTLVAMRVR
jgi:sigma-B regulation protein RsbU (phosphoserine phosphatase)